MDETIEIVAHSIKLTPHVINTCEMHQIIKYFAVCNRGRYPSLDEYIQTLNNVRMALTDPRSYEEKEKVITPCDISPYYINNYGYQDKIKKGTIDTCALCKDDIQSSHVYKLPCGHVYHYRDKDCLGTTIREWFKEHKLCPTCRYEIGGSKYKK